MEQEISLQQQNKIYLQSNCFLAILLYNHLYKVQSHDDSYVIVCKMNYIPDGIPLRKTLCYTLQTIDI